MFFIKISCLALSLLSHLDVSIVFYSVLGFLLLLFLFSVSFSSFFGNFFYKLENQSKRLLSKESKWFLN